MSRSAKSAPQPPAENSSAAGTPTKVGGKGRPTPSRKEAEAAARARAKTPRSRKEIAAANRKARESASAKVREAYRTGDETHLPSRDRGPVRRFVRDYIDVRFSFIELLLPLMVVVLLLGFVPSESVRASSEILLLGVMLFIVLEMVFLRMKLRKELKARFPEADLKGTTYYAISRAMQMKFMRLPKPQRKIGDALGENYR
ncbi:DUF3043 domain-containing protein [Nocardioides yefusunii]|uniref:DUF3043 domain-containing protein n=1 Tax=Nocardioides yefusunii TaxID=2500546 RepID=A0ABW1QXV8_9ACTN|nr:DUF3043 domain-containing protein [Nocardioides yefusunii]